MTESAADRTAAPIAPDERGTPPPGRTRGGRLTLREFTGNRLAVLGGGIIVFFVLFCFVGPHLYVTEQTAVDPVNSMLPPGGGHPLGTDAQGFDVLGRIMKGGQASLQIGLFAALIATAIGTLYGTVAGLAGGLADAVMMRVVDTLLSIPFLFIVLIIATRFSSTVLSLSLTLGAFSWLAPARLVRAEVLALRSRGFVAAATVMGATKARIIVRHLIPNALGVVIVNITFQVADAIIAVSLLGFLGFGLNYPAVEWGTQLSKGVSSLLDGSWWLIYPVGGCLVLVVMAFNFVGDALRDSIDVRLRRR
ncbi:ABC transporter permease [Actinomadura nitritigenes]|uniref:ABC transporter permease n=1 Tax=Actinomadura nitritigenes TaxID=134602 RepID=A0ABS3R591_9ACTN|nr:ABC transporter permease [Actinomadura nitritigenes]MBO2441291.1 ABC transporter permease [Actinomadura nitritigenes]